MFHESGEESLEQGARGCGCSWSRRMQDLECGPAPSPTPLFRLPASFVYLTPLHTQAIFSREQKPSIVCKINYLSDFFRQPLPPSSTSLDHKGGFRQVKCGKTSSTLNQDLGFLRPLPFPGNTNLIIRFFPISLQHRDPHLLSISN